MHAYMCTCTVYYSLKVVWSTVITSISTSVDNGLLRTSVCSTDPMFSYTLQSASLNLTVAPK